MNVHWKRWIAAYTACAIATIALLAGLDSPAMWILCTVLAAALVGVVYAVRPPAGDVVVPQQRDGGVA